MLRILRVHNRYQERGGEDASFEAECALLEERGHPIMTLQFDNHKIGENRSFHKSMSLGIATVWSKSGIAQVTQAIRDFGPDLAHFDNTFPLVSPGSYSACHHLGIPVVQSLRNYRLLCPAATFFRNEHICEQCLGKTFPWPGITHSCYRESRSQTSTVATMLAFHNLRRTWHKDVDLYIVLTEFARTKFIDGGLPADRLIVKPNFLQGPRVIENGVRDGYLYVGRLSAEKGINTLLATSRRSTDSTFTIIGDGPLATSVTTFTSNHNHVTYRGRLPSTDTYALMASSRALIFPSEWYETFGRVVVEAFAVGTPVIASNLGAMAEIVDDHRTGLLFEPGNAADLAAKIRWANEHPDKMREYGMNARMEYERKYTAERNYELLMDIYQQAIDHRQAHPPARWPR